jgi:hypothetical protein
MSNVKVKMSNKIPNPKHQITNKSQVPSTNDQKRLVIGESEFVCNLEVEYRNLFGIWDLEFVISNCAA